jgi:Flp pilus assembly protein TadD
MVPILAMLAVALVCGWLGCARKGERGVPEEIVRHNVLGTAYLGQGKWTEAEQEFARALELRPRDALLLNNLAVAEVQQGRLDEAEQHLKEAIALDPEQAYARYGLGTLLKNRGDFAAAAKEFEVVESIDPNDLMTHYNLGMAYSRIDREAEARQRFERALELDPTHVSSLYGLGRLLLQAGEQERGMELINRSQAIRERSGLDEAVGTQYGEQGPYAMGADYPGWALAAPEAKPVRLAPRAAAPLEPAPDGGAVVAFAAAPGADARPVVYVVDGSGALRSFDADGAVETILAPPQAHVVAVAAGAMRRDSTAIDVVALEPTDGGLRALVLADGKPAPVDDSTPPTLATAQAPVAVDATLVDRDHDGDLDLFLCWTAEANAGCGFGTNDGAGHLALTSSTDHGFPITPTAPGRIHVGFTDFDNDRDIDLLLGRPGRIDVFSNRRDGTFEEVSERVGLGPAASDTTGAFTIADLDKNGWMDLVCGTSTNGARAYETVRGHFDHLGSFLRESDGLRVDHVVVFDHDNDGFLDIARPSRGGLAINRNLGAREWTSEPLSYSDAQDAPLAPLVALDADGDGDLDLVAARGGPEPGIVLLDNEGGNAYGFIRIVSHGVADNAYGIGAKVEVLAGALRQKHEIVSPLPLHQGLGPRKTVESVRHVWPAGVLQDEISLEAGRSVDVTQLDRKGTSCPLLYARSTEGGWRFVTDFLGGSAVGYRLGPDALGTPDPDEYVKIEDGIAPDRNDGTLRLRVNNQLQEVIWFDALELLVVDHPAGTEVFPSERLLPGPPWAPFELYAGSDLRTIARASARAAREGEEDVTELLARLDRRYVRGFGLLPFKGYAEPHGLELDLGPLPRRERVVLLLDGWIDYADSSANVAAAQAGFALSPPRLLVGDGRGSFRDAGLRMGFPAGLPKTMTVDLTGRLDARDPRVRIETNMRIYWDRARVLVGGADVPLVVTRVPARTAELREGGFPRELREDRTAPPVYDAARVSYLSPWTVHTGRYTAFGEVADLLGAVDDRFVTTRSGDEIELVFEAPPAAAGVRTFLLHADGFGKDMDPNSAAADAIAPIPFHAMTGYPYGEDVHPPSRSLAADRLTRIVLDWPPGTPGAVPQPVVAADAAR